MGGNSKYNVAGGVARAYLISNFGWTIADGVQHDKQF